MSNLAHQFPRIPNRVPIYAGTPPVDVCQYQGVAYPSRWPKRRSITPLDLQEEENRYVVYFYLRNCTHTVARDKTYITVSNGVLHIKASSNEDDRVLARRWATATGIPECIDFGILLPDQADVNRISAYRVADTIKVIIPKCQMTN